MPDEITIDGMAEEEFRRSIESMLRNGQADDAASKLKALVADHAGEDNILAERFLTVSAGDITLGGWDRLAQQLDQYDRAENRITAISVDIADPEDAGVWPDQDGQLTPFIETNFFTDSAYPFSVMDREDLLDGYTMYGCEWQGNYDQADSTLSVQGIDDLYGSIVSLEMEVSQYEEPPLEEINAGALGACYLAVLVHQAVRDAALKLGLPRPLCLISGSNNAYPFFDAPVLTIEEYVSRGSVKHELETREPAVDDEAEDALQPAEMASLESLTMPRKKVAKKMALMVEGAGEDYSPIPEEQITSEPLDEFVGVTELDDSPVEAKSPARDSLSKMINSGGKAPPLFINRGGNDQLPKHLEIRQPEIKPLDLRLPERGEAQRIPDTEDQPAPAEIAAKGGHDQIDSPMPEEPTKADLPGPVEVPEAKTPQHAPSETDGTDQPDIASDLPLPEEISDSEDIAAPIEPAPEDTQPGFDVDLFSDQSKSEDSLPADKANPAEAEIANTGDPSVDTEESGNFEVQDEAAPAEPESPDSQDTALPANSDDTGAAAKPAPDSNERLFELLGLGKEHGSPKPHWAFENTLAENPPPDHGPASDEKPPVAHAAPHPLRAGFKENPPPQPDVTGPPSDAVWRQLLPTLANWVDAFAQNRLARRIGRWFS